MSSNELVTLRRYHKVKETEKGLFIHVVFMFNRSIEGGATVSFPKKLFQNGVVPRWLVKEKELELAAEGGYNSCHILIDENNVDDDTEDDSDFKYEED